MGERKKEVVINMPEVNSSKYKAQVREIEESVRGLESFTSNLESKVGMMLKGQETEFVNSYRHHITTVELALRDYEARIADYQRKVEYYENEGALATMIKKIAFLEAHEKKLLDKIQSKDRLIFDLRTEIASKDREITSLQEKVKELLRSSEPLRTMRECGRGQRESARGAKESEPTFTTEIPITEKSILKSNQSLERIDAVEVKYRTISNPTNPEERQEWRQELTRARQQVESIKRRNRQLSSVNSRIIDRAGETDQFFLRVLNQLKRKITVRKQFKECSFSDFKQEDKLELLVKLLSNDDILHHLYTRIFRKTPLLPPPGIASEDVTARPLLPAIASARRP